MKARRREIAKTAKLSGAVLLLTAALAVPAAAQPRYGYGTPYRTVPRSVVDGVISDEGGRCPVLRDRQNRNYYLQGDTRGLRPGDQVSLRERLLSRSSCGSDAPTLQVLEIRTVWTDGRHRSAYFDAARDGSFDRFIVRNRYRGGWYADRYSYLQSGGPNGGYGQYPGRDQGQYQGYDDRYPQREHRAAPNRPRDDRYAPPSDAPPGAVPPNEPNGPNRGQYDQPPYDQQDDQSGQYDDRGNRGGQDRDDRQPTTVEGTLDYTGSCPALHDRNGTSYDLAGDLGDYHDGDQVRVTGLLGGTSSCGGTALEIQEIRRR